MLRDTCTTQPNQCRYGILSMRSLREERASAKGQRPAIWVAAFFFWAFVAWPVLIWKLGNMVTTGGTEQAGPGVLRTAVFRCGVGVGLAVGFFQHALVDGSTDRQTKKSR